MSGPKVSTYRDESDVDPENNSTVTRTEFEGGGSLEEFDYDANDPGDEATPSSDEGSGSDTPADSASDDDDGDPSYLDDNS